MEDYISASQIRGRDFKWGRVIKFWGRKTLLQQSCYMAKMFEMFEISMTRYFFSTGTVVTFKNCTEVTVTGSFLLYTTDYTSFKQACGGRVFYHFACWPRLILLATDMNPIFCSYNCNKLKCDPLQFDE